MSQQLPRNEYTVGWVCALPIEFAAAQEMLDEEHADLLHEPDDNDENTYALGSIGGHNVAIGCLPAGRIGNNPAAAVAMQMRATFKGLRFSLMVGVGGGVPSAEADIRLGDVVVSQPDKTFNGVVQYDFGKTTPSGFGRTGALNAPPQTLLGAVAKVRANELRGRTKMREYIARLDYISEFQRSEAGPDILFEATYDHERGQTCDGCLKHRQVSRPPRNDKEVVVHYGTIASGNQVMKSAAQRDKVSEDLGGVLCFEMEAAGLMNSFPCLVVRGICDYADSHKNERWQPYAAGVAAAYAKELLSVIPAADVVKNVTVYDAIDRGVESDLNDKLAHMAQYTSFELNWRTSIVDLLKLLRLGSDMEARKQLAERLHIRAGPNGSPKQNQALYKAVMKELAVGESKWAQIMESRRRNGRCFNCGLEHWEYECRDNCGKCMTTVSVYNILIY